MRAFLLRCVGGRWFSSPEGGEREQSDWTKSVFSAPSSRESDAYGFEKGRDSSRPTVPTISTITNSDGFGKLFFAVALISSGDVGMTWTVLPRSRRGALWRIGFVDADGGQGCRGNAWRGETIVVAEVEIRVLCASSVDEDSPC